MSINISIKKEAYDFLSRLKIKNKSFSDVILEFKGNDRDIMKFFGVLKGVDWKTKGRSMQEFRDSFKRRLT